MRSPTSRTYLPLLLVLFITPCSVWLYAQRPLNPFVPPDKAAREKAVGDTSEFSPQLKAAFDSSASAFQPIPTPAESDWLANHREPGQTFSQFLETPRNQPDKTRNTLYILPLGEFEQADTASLLEPLRDYSQRFFNLPTKLLPIEKATAALGIKTRINHGTGKRQLLSTDILALLPKKLPRDAFCMLAVTTEDLYPDESWNFVFGQASLRERVGVFSFARYNPTFFGHPAAPAVEKLVLRRSCDVLVHETGHMFGIRHCIHFHCIMNGSNHLAESDAAPMHLCPACLRKLHRSTGLDPAKRYAELAKFYTKHSFEAENKWAETRAAATR